MDFLEIVKLLGEGVLTLLQAFPPRIPPGSHREDQGNSRENSWCRLDAGSGITENSTQTFLP